MMDNCELAVIEKISEARAFLDMSREEFAKLFGMNNASLYKLEKGIYKLYVKRLADIAEAIKVDITYFFSSQPYPEAVTTYLDGLKTIKSSQDSADVLGVLSQNENLMSYINKRLVANEDNSDVTKKDFNSRIGFLIDQLSLKDIESLYSLTLWFMKNQGYSQSYPDNSDSDELDFNKYSDPLILLKLPKEYDDMYKASQGPWKVKADRFNKVKYILPIENGVIKEVYFIENRNTVDVDGQQRHTFTGTIADDLIRNRYLGKSVSHLKSRGSQNPILYINA